MAVPSYQEFLRPLLALGLDGEVYMKDAIKKLASLYGLTESDQKELLPSGQTVLYNRIHWARTYLDKGAFHNYGSR